MTRGSRGSFNDSRIARTEATRHEPVRALPKADETARSVTEDMRASPRAGAGAGQVAEGFSKARDRERLRYTGLTRGLMTIGCLTGDNYTLWKEK